MKHKNLPIYHVPNKDLRDFTTTEKDMNKHHSKFPTADYRVKQGEDLFNEAGTASSSTVSMVDPNQDESVFSGTTTGESDFLA
mmetsp:Transcript_31959/g.39671  ORF Transcript_31959/g.39671 Transcript_31959/m.39671 type:complete len:83 (+) Transcript_31959:385-633(+)